MPLFHKIWVGAQVDAARVLEDQIASRRKQPARKDQFHNLLTASEIVWSVREYQAVLSRAAFEVEEDVCLDGVDAVQSQRGCRVADKVVMHSVYLHGGHRGGAPRGELVAYRPRAGKQVEHLQAFKLHKVAQHIENVLFGKICCGSRPEVARRDDAPASMFSAYYPHRKFLEKNVPTV